MNVEIKEINAAQTWAIRHKVMWPNEPLSYVKIPDDDKGQHLGLFVGDQLTSVISLFMDEDKNVQFRKFATLIEEQGKGYGAMLLEKVIDIAKGRGAKLLWCNARASATILYEREGLKQTDTSFIRKGILFVRMEKKLY
ncbi:GNAT family N-acetyltransferase [Flammeovirga yaeyamensis]|uniref:GNAT family N-acetyltransferase n=2 Tax=Flammeovirga yaeyamensis TaxID=367791 RepID=A0AAX1N678_9BACT|nr:GNAT family N-acetyltransferase [Flammeovirga yaeyamensis]MBB3700750.1 GNAT superfamily N-acetyltransferase [Flammeovirga yaeyamensis]NMF37894.1 GNAT family N-acetyltransferase [Flammeovirga yaeyamensis]QWG01745.1 GNAT family N-acetyltransferase [Flammeovirga yaeyamensis]